MTQVSPTKRYCVLVWGAAVLLPCLLIAAIAIPWLGEFRRVADAIAAGSEQLGRYQRLIATLPGLRAELEQVNSNEDFKAFYFDAPTRTWPVRS